MKKLDQVLNLNLHNAPSLINAKCGYKAMHSLIW